MAFYKICSCGERIISERRNGFPDLCPSCGRDLVRFSICDENEEQNNQSELPLQEEEPVQAVSVSGKKRYSLILENGKEINIPKEGCIIGRTEVGAEELAEFPSVSRQHLRVTVRRNIGVLAEDISSFGTLVNGNRLEKNVVQQIPDGSKITLCNVDAVLSVKEDIE